MNNTWKEVESKGFDEYFITRDVPGDTYRITEMEPYIIDADYDQFTLEGINNLIKFKVNRHWMYNYYTPTLYANATQLTISFGDLSIPKNTLTRSWDIKKHDITNCDIKHICTCGAKKALTTHAFWCDSIVKENV